MKHSSSFQEAKCCPKVFKPSVECVAQWRLETRWLIAGRSKFVGVELNNLAKLRQDHIDLTSRLEFTEAAPNSIRTNLAIRTRIQIPIGGGVFVLGDQRNGKTMAVLLSATVP